MLYAIDRIERHTPTPDGDLLQREAVLTYYPDIDQSPFYIFDHPCGSFVLPEQPDMSPLYHLYVALQHHFGEDE